MYAKRFLSACLVLGLVLLSTAVVSTQGPVPERPYRGPAPAPTVPPAPTIPARLFFPVVFRPFTPTPWPTPTPTATPRAVVPLRVDRYWWESGDEDPVGFPCWLHVQITNPSSQTIQRVHITIYSFSSSRYGHLYQDVVLMPNESIEFILGPDYTSRETPCEEKRVELSAEGYVLN